MNKKIADAVERYANQNIPRFKDEFGQFMYHAELIKRGHRKISEKDSQTLSEKYQKKLKEIIRDNS